MALKCLCHKELHALSSMAEFIADSLFPTRTEAETRITGAVIKGEVLSVTILHQVFEWPGLWLRYNCQCTDCFSPTSLSFTVSLRTILQEDSKLVSATISKNGLGVACTWSDGHSCVFAADWLFNRRITKEAGLERTSVISNHQMVYWPDPQDMFIQRATWQEVTETCEGFAKFGHSLIRDGVFLMSGAPDGCVCREFSEKICAPLSSTQYGYEFIIESSPNPVNVAYSSDRIEFHVDSPYLGNIPKVLFLHCIKQAGVGGESILTDGLKAAELLKKRHPEHYETLCKVKMVHEDLMAMPGKNHHYTVNTKPIINEDEEGRPESIIFSNHGHSSYYNGSISDLQNWLKAMKEFFDILYEISIKLKVFEGDIMVIDNRRILHGREGYDSSHGRKLEGFYTDWDYIHSRLRVAQIKLSAQTAE